MPAKTGIASAMIELEQRLQQRFPQWFRGRRAVIARPLVRGLGRWSRLDVIDAFLAANRGLRGFDFVAAALQFLGARYQVDPVALALAGNDARRSRDNNKMERS